MLNFDRFFILSFLETWVQTWVQTWLQTWVSIVSIPATQDPKIQDFQKAFLYWVFLRHEFRLESRLDFRLECHSLDSCYPRSKIQDFQKAFYIEFLETWVQTANLLRRLFQVEADLTSNSCGWNLELGRPLFARLPFLTFWGPKKGPFFVTLFCSNFHSLEALEAPLEACPDVFCSNFHGLATLEFKTCIEACLQLCFIL